MIIGITGTLSSGKDTVAEYFIGKGFTAFSTADELRSYMEQHKLPLDRDTMRDMGQRVRQEHGDDILERWAAAKFPHGQPVIITAMRHPAGIEYLRTLPDFFLIAVDAPIELRFERALARGRIGDGVTLDIFRSQEDEERKTVGSAQQLDVVMGMADYVITNNGTLEELHAQLEGVYQEILQRVAQQG